MLLVQGNNMELQMQIEASFIVFLHVSCLRKDFDTTTPVRIHRTSPDVIACFFLISAISSFCYIVLKI